MQSLAFECILSRPITRRRVTCHNKPSTVTVAGHANTDLGRGWPDRLFDINISAPIVSKTIGLRSSAYLGVMSVASKISLADLLAVIVLLLIHPSFACGFEAAIWLAPVEILTLVRALVTTTVLQAFVCSAEVLGVSNGVLFQFVIPDEIRSCVTTRFRGVATSWTVENILISKSYM